ncbi:MAG TPA: archaetidylserine decarboxylase [Steroidobacteraceae bacterium]|nr:archaetidylserine decarboxylase [Steroidobacteraceae bacterium]
MTGDSEGAAARAFVALQYLLPQHLLSALVHEITRSELRWLKNVLIGAFMQRFRPDMRDAAQPDPFAFGSFNDFFTRALRGDARPLDGDASTVLSPVDGSVSQIGRLDGSWLVQAKGHAYTLESLLASDGPWTETFRGGAFATLYLAPFNYHRIHMPLEATLRAAWYVPGQLFSVNATTAASVPGLFARNERVVCVFGAGELSFALVLVGALFVGSISTVWHGEVTPRRPRQRTELPLDASRAGLTLARGAELGRFNMGSTVILLLPAQRAEWLAPLAPGSSVRVGQAIARLT